MLPTVNRRLFLRAASSVTALPFLGMGATVLAQDATGVTIRHESDISNLDPANRVGGVDETVIRAACQNLASFKANSLDWELDAAKVLTQVSDTVIAFELNPGQMFHGGYGEMTADDVKFSFERYVVPAADGALPAFAADFSSLDHVEVTGTYTGKIILKNPSPALWTLGICDCSGAILSRKAYEALGDKISTQIIGSGPYAVTDWQPGQHIILEQSADYVGPNAGRFQKITIKPIPEPRTAVLSLLAGELGLSEIASQDEGQLEGAEGVVAVKTNRLDYTWIGMNMSKGPLADLRVRQAVRLGIDIDAILAGAFGGVVERANALLAPGLVGHWADAPAYVRDIEAAKALLAEAGHSDLTLSFTYLNDSTNEALAQIVQANLAEIGVTVTLNGMETAVYYGLGADDGAKDLELMLIFFAGKNDPSFQTQWFTATQIGSWNWQRWNSPEFDQLDKEAATILDQEARAQKYIRMQQLMHESAAYVWVTHGTFVYGHADWLKPAAMPSGTGWQPRLFDLA